MNHTITNTGNGPPRTVTPNLAGRILGVVFDKTLGPHTPDENRTIVIGDEHAATRANRAGTSESGAIDPTGIDTTSSDTTSSDTDGMDNIVYVVAMRDTSGDTAWYQITKDWYDWASAVWDGSCPADLTDARITSGSGDLQPSDYSHHTRQHLAVDANMIAEELDELISRYPVGTVIFELAGTWY